MLNNICPLCNSLDLKQFSKDKKREYLKCNNCSTIFVPKCYHLSIEDEKRRYDLHTNSADDIFYVNFLDRIVEPVINRIKKGNKGLDFGCGPGPILKELFSHHNIELWEYDLYYKNTSQLLIQNWDFIITTEVVEHLKEPMSVISELWNIIKNDGILAIMTSLYNNKINFASWYYKGDPTHIVFFTKESFIWIADKLNAKVEFIDKDIIILKKN